MPASPHRRRALDALELRLQRAVNASLRKSSKLDDPPSSIDALLASIAVDLLASAAPAAVDWEAVRTLLEGRGGDAAEVVPPREDLLEARGVGGEVQADPVADRHGVLLPLEVLEERAAQRREDRLTLRRRPGRRRGGVHGPLLHVHVDHLGVHADDPPESVGACCHRRQGYALSSSPWTTDTR